MEIIYGPDFLYAGPLFIHQFSHAWIDFRGIHDRFMREKGCDYFENSRRAVHVQRAYACINPRGHAGYDEDCGGCSACEGPTDRSEEHTSELQSLMRISYAVFCLKKKTHIKRLTMSTLN